MKIEAKLTYRQANKLMAAGIFVNGLKESIKEWEGRVKTLREASEALKPFTPHLRDNSQEDLSEILPALKFQISKIIENKDLRKYFFEEEGTTELTLLYENLIGSAGMAFALIQNGDLPEYRKNKQTWLNFINDTVDHFCAKIEEDFGLVELKS